MYNNWFCQNVWDILSCCLHKCLSGGKFWTLATLQGCAGVSSKILHKFEKRNVWRKKREKKELPWKCIQTIQTVLASFWFCYCWDKLMEFLQIKKIYINGRILKNDKRNKWLFSQCEFQRWQNENSSDVCCEMQLKCLYTEWYFQPVQCKKDTVDLFEFF